MSLFRNVIWYLKGSREYTKSGYVSASKQFHSADLDVNVAGRSFMITGANSGLGKCAALEIAKRGGTVHMVCRNQVKGQDAKEEIVRVTGSQEVYLHELDMSQPRKIKKFVSQFRQEGYKLNVLINNAGCMMNTRELTTDGLEKNFATNTLGVHILTTSLIPLLMESEKPRIVIVSSGGMLVQKLNLNDLQFEKMSPFDGTMAYAQNKRQQVVMAEMYSKQNQAIHVSSMHPGWADTPAVRLSMPDFYEKMKDKLRTVDQGADTIVWLAISEAAVNTKGGEFFQDRKVTSKHLPLAWTKSSDEEKTRFMSMLDDMATKFAI